MPEQLIERTSPAERVCAFEHCPARRSNSVHFHELVCVLAASAIYLFPFIRLLHRIGDEGTIVYGAQRVLEGAVPYRDFIEVMGPGSFYWLAIFFKVFGDSWQVSRLCLWVTGVSATTLLYWIARQYLNRSYALLASWYFALISIPLWPAPNHHLDSNLFTLASIAAFTYWNKTRHIGYLAFAGFLAGVTSCFIQPKGLYLLVAFIAVIFVVDRKHAPFKASLVLLVSYFAVGIAIIASFYRTGALPDLIYCTFRWPLSGYDAVNSGVVWYTAIAALAPGALYKEVLPFWLAPLFVIGCVFPFLLLILSPVITLAAVVLVVWKRRPEFSLTLMLPALAIWLSEIHRKDLFHFAFGAPLLIVVCIQCLAYIHSRQPRKALLFVLTLALSLVALGDFWNARRGYPIETRRGTILDVQPDEALVFLNTLVPKGEQVFVYPYCPMYYYLADVRNPTRFSILMYDYNTREQFDEVVRDLDNKHVKFVLWDTVVDGANLRRWFPAYRQPAARELKLEQYLNTAYELISVKNGFRILRRRQS